MQYYQTAAGPCKNARWFAQHLSHHLPASFMRHSGSPFLTSVFLTTPITSKEWDNFPPFVNSQDNQQSHAHLFRQMADPLSIAASIAGLASLAGTVFMALNNYRVSVRDARTEVAAFATELRNLSGMLQNLSLLAGTLPLSEGKTMSLDKSQISEMEEMIGTVDKKISKATKDFQAKKQKRIMRSLRWHFSKEEVDKLLDQIRAYKATINLALSADTLERLNECLKVHKKLEASIMSSQKALKLLQDTQDRVRMDKKKQKTFDYFLKVNPQPFLQTSLRLREETTGEWLVRDPMVAQWMSIPSSKLWLSGIPGAGKTVLCGLLIASILENLQSGMAFAFFFCDYKESATQNLSNILSSIALQLALQKDEAFDRLQAYYGQLHPKNGLPREVEPDQLMELIQDMSRLFDGTSIVIDALDECDANMRGVARGLVRVANESHNLSVALFSREIVDISDELEAHFQKLEIAARNEDLERYISNQMMMRTSLSKLDAEESLEIRERLLGKAHGMFRWVACQLDSLEDIGRMARKTALEELPPTLNRTYDRILERRSGNSISREIVRRTLHWICYDKTLTIRVLKEALTVSLIRDRLIPTNSELVGEDEIGSYCSSLIRKGQSGRRFEIAHFTVEEYLRTGIPPGSELASFRYSTSGTSQSMTILSLRYILQPNFGYQPFANEEYEGKIRDRAETHPFYLYASTFWPLQTECHDDAVVNESPEDYLTRDTVEAIKLQFHLGKPLTGSALHNIIQRILDRAESTEEHSSVGEAIRLTEEMVRFGGAWGQYSHFQNEGILVLIEDDAFESSLRVAAAQNRATEVSDLLQDVRFDPTSETTYDILREAIASDRVDIVEAFLQHRSQLVYETNRAESIWHIAAREDAINVIQLLLKDVSSIQKNLKLVSSDGYTPFAKGVHHGSLKTSALLLAHCSDDPAFFQSELPVLHLCVSRNWPNLFNALLKKTTIKSDEDSYGRTPLFFVPVSAEIQFIQEIATRYSPDHQDKNGRVAFQDVLWRLLNMGLGTLRRDDHFLTIFKALAPTNWRVAALERPGQHMWEYFCRCVGDRGRTAIRPAEANSLIVYIGWLCKAGVVDSYEEQSKLPALVPLIEALESLGLTAGEYRWEQDFVAEALKHLRQRSMSRLEFLDSDSAMVALLEKSVQQDHYGLVSFLTENGTPTHRAGNESSPLIKACVSGSVRTFSRILRSTPSSVLENTAEIQPDILCRLILKATDKKSSNIAIQKLQSALQHCLSPDTVTTVDLMLDWNADPIACDPVGWDVAAHYVSFNELKRLRDLVDKLRSQSTEIKWSRAISLRTMHQEDKGTYLHFAKSGEMVDFIIKTTSVIGVNSTSSSHITPLHVASSTGSTDAIKALIRHGAIIDAVTRDGKRPLDLASKHGHADAVRLLLELGAVQYSDINAGVNSDGETSLMLAVRSSRDDCTCVQKLLDDGADTALRNMKGISALMVAATLDFIQVAKLLVEANAPIHVTTAFGENILNISARCGATRCFMFFLQLGCDAHHKDLLGFTAFDRTGMVPRLLSYCVKANTIFGATIRSKQTVIRDAVRINCGTVLQIVRGLPRSEVPLLTSAKRGHKCSVLCWAIAHGCTRCVNTFLTFGGDTEIEGSVHGTPVMQACAFGQLSMVKLLVRNNAKLGYIDKRGVHRNAFDEAQEWPDIIQWLLVGRFQDQVKLCMEAHNPEAEVMPWTGPRHFEYPWKRHHDMRSDGSQIDHLKLMTKIKAVVRGEVVEGRLSVNTSEGSEGQRRL
ncbi:ankyrin [Apiospora kogelbergensis]|uniref:Ankyrin n=1 Tax=Apiospora kogelbergensis TaxID=1337665 RepID=A0AAW0RBE8_9PEZI